MTVVAGQFAVVSVERKLSIARMVEACVVPSGWVMAVLAFVAALTIVRVVFRVAAVTGRSCVLERLIFVAGKALRLPV